MALKLALALLFFSTWCLAQPDFSKVPQATDSTYGYTATNPLKLKKGNPQKSIGYSYDFLNILVTRDNKPLKFVQRRTIGNPEMSKREAQLDKYVFLTHARKDTVTIYVDIYSKGNLRIPLGLKYKQN